MSADVSESRVKTLWSSKVNFVHFHHIHEAPECNCPVCSGLEDDVVGVCENYHKREED